VTTGIDLIAPGADLPPPPPPPPPPTDGGTATDMLVGTDTLVPPQTMTFMGQVGPIPLAKGEETVVCSEIKLGNDVDVWVRRISAALAPGSHHLIFYRTSATQENPGPFPCRSFDGILRGYAPLFIAQTATAELNFPDGIALKFKAGAIIRIEAHYINTTPNPIQGQGNVSVDAVQIDSPLTEADLLFYGTTQIDVPAMAQDYALPYNFGHVPSGVNVFGLTSHTHKLGVDFQIEQSDNGAPGTLLYRNQNNWDNPPLMLFDPVLSFSANQGLRWSCSYTNPTASDVTFGESANDEMCFLWAYYYPSQGFLACAPPLLQCP
jgi:hypothetical protein